MAFIHETGRVTIGSSASLAEARLGQRRRHELVILVDDISHSNPFVLYSILSETVNENTNLLCGCFVNPALLSPGPFCTRRVIHR